MADQRPGVGQLRMTVAEDPEFVYGTCKRERTAEGASSVRKKKLESLASGEERTGNLEGKQR